MTNRAEQNWPEGTAHTLMGVEAAHESGAFLGSADDLTRNINAWSEGLSTDDRKVFNDLYRQNVKDWRE